MVKSNEPFNLNPSQNNRESHSSEWPPGVALHSDQSLTNIGNNNTLRKKGNIICATRKGPNKKDSVQVCSH